MRNWAKRFARAATLVDVTVTVAGLAVLGGLLIPALAINDDAARRRQCAGNLRQIGFAIVQYADPNGEFYPCHWDGMRLDGTELAVPKPSAHPKNPNVIVLPSISNDQLREGYDNPMASLALLANGYIDGPMIFGCPSTDDKPVITSKFIGARGGAWRGCFGTPPDKMNPSVYSGMAEKGPSTTNQKSSYFYDSLCHFRAIGPSTPMAADADGHAWRYPDGVAPGYRDGWQRTPREPNHVDGQNVLYADAHVAWMTTNYCSGIKQDNIFAINLMPPTQTGDPTWNADADVALWDEGGSSKQPFVGQYPDTDQLPLLLQQQ